MDMQVTTNDSLIGNMTEHDSFVDSRDFARMTRAIEFIEREFERQPRLAQIARHVGPVGISFQPPVPALDRAHSQAISGGSDRRAATPALRRRTFGHGCGARGRTFGRRASA